MRKKIILICFYLLIYKTNTVVAQIQKQNELKSISCKQIIDTIKEHFFYWYGVYDTIQNVMYGYNTYDTIPLFLDPSSDPIYANKSDYIDFKFNMFPFYFEIISPVFNKPNLFKDSLILYIQDIKLDWNYKYEILYLLQNQCIDSLYKLINITFKSVKDYDKLKLNNKGYNDSFKLNAFTLMSLIRQFHVNDLILTKFPPDKEFILMLESIKDYYNTNFGIYNNYSKQFTELYINYKKGVFYRLKKQKKTKYFRGTNKVA